MAGRSGKYESHVKPNFETIDKLLNDGASEEQVAESLGISYSSWNNYKRQHEEFDALCKKPRVGLVLKLRSALIRRALGEEYTEKKTYYRFPRGSKKQEDIEYMYVEEYKKYNPPDVAALNLALKNYDKENWANDPQALELKQRELELREEALKSKDW